MALLAGPWCDFDRWRRSTIKCRVRAPSADRRTLLRALQAQHDRDAVVVFGKRHVRPRAAWRHPRLFSLSRRQATAERGQAGRDSRRSGRRTAAAASSAPATGAKSATEIEKPASSAPRAESDTDIDTQKLDPETHAPKADTPPQDGQPQPKQDAAEADANPTAQDDKEAAAPPPDILKDDEEALDKAAPTPKPDTSQAEKATVAAKAKPAKTARKQFAGLSDLPDYKFARKTKKSLVSGGTEDSRYLAIVYGLITRNLQASGKGSVTVSFELDDDGDVVGVEMTRSSGDPLSDAEVVNAVRRTSPFPPPPPNRPHGLTATINFDSIGAARPLAMGAR